MHLAGLVVIADDRARLWKSARRELRRVGCLGLIDVAAYRAYARVRLRRAEHAWKTAELDRLRAAYPANLETVPRVSVSNPNSEEARAFLAGLAPDVLIARCKFILKPGVFGLARVGAFALHPGICPEYRNAHGCFWALASRDLDRVGMTLLKIDAGIDTGPVYLHAGCTFDEVDESHTIIQYRAVLENLDRIEAALRGVCDGTLAPVDIAGRKSAVWGQPRLTEYLRWKRAARRAQKTHASRIPAVP